MATERTQLGPEARIELPKLELGTHHFRLEMDAAFFQRLAVELQVREPLQVTILLLRTRTLLDLQLQLQGTMLLACDRCLRDYAHPVALQQRLVYSHSSSLEAHEGSDVQYLPLQARFLELAQDLYEVLLLSLPIRRIPADCPGPACPPEVLRLLGEEPATDTVTQGASDTTAAPDPRWAALLALRGDVPPEESPASN